MPDEPDLKVGDVCRNGVNAFPRYRIIHLHEGRVWLRDIDSGVDAVVDVDQCRRAGEEPGEDEPHHDPEESALVTRPLGPGIRVGPDGRRRY